MMENIRIKILKDTPFNLAGEILKLYEFRLIYRYICESSVSDKELVDYISIYKSFPALKQTSKYCINEWFEVITLENLEPLNFIYEGVYFVKDFDGLYRGYSSPDQYELREKHKISGRVLTNDVSPVRTLSISEVRKLIEESKYKQHILYCTNSINKKL